MDEVTIVLILNGFWRLNTNLFYFYVERPFLSNNCDKMKIIK